MGLADHLARVADPRSLHSNDGDIDLSDTFTYLCRGHPLDSVSCRIPLDRRVEGGAPNLALGRKIANPVCAGLRVSPQAPGRVYRFRHYLLSRPFLVRATAFPARTSLKNIEKLL
jgi:hypothetical protein